MRVYSARSIENDQIITPDDFNQSNSSLASVLNGGVDMNNLPVDLGAARFRDRVRSTPITGINKSTGPFGDFYNGLTTGDDYLDPIYTIALRTGTFSPDWNEFSSDVALSSLTIPDLKEGLLMGHVIVDWSRKSSWYSGLRYSDETPTNWAIFYDGQILKTTGPLYPRRATTCLPFSVWTNSNQHTLTLKWKSSYDSETDSSADEYDGDFKIFSVGWAFRSWAR